MPRTDREGGRTYTGIPAASALAMGFYESRKISGIIDGVCPPGSRTLLSVGQAVKAMIGPMFDVTRKLPLYCVGEFYKAAPVEAMFGAGVTSLEDTRLSRCLDELFSADRDELLWKISEAAREIFSLDSDIYHMDSTNISVYCRERSPDLPDAAVAVFSGHAKDGRNDLRQYAAQALVGGDRVLRYLRPYDGDEADQKMNRDTLRWLAKHLDDTSGTTVVADCKLVDAATVDLLTELGFGFVSKCPERYGGCIRDTVAASAFSGDMDSIPGKGGWQVYDTDAEVNGRKLRFVAIRSLRKRDALVRKARECDGRKISKMSKRLGSTDFFCEDDAEAGFASAVKTLGLTSYRIGHKIVKRETYERRSRAGRPKKGEEPNRKIMYRVVCEPVFEEKRARENADRDSISVLVTNLPRAPSDADNVRDGSTAEKVLRLYLDEVKAEHTFRLTKSGLGADEIYVHTPSRANSLLFVAGVAAVLGAAMTEAFAKAGVGRTFERVCDELMSARVVYNEGTDTVTFEGSPADRARFWEYVDILGIDDALLLGRAQ